ncbi:MAG: MoxR family ATPase [Acidobacteriota bacterium]
MKKSPFLPESIVGQRQQLPGSEVGSAVHVFDRASVDAVNSALAAGRPLLLRGEPGTGKSQLARAAAQVLGRPFLASVMDSQVEARDLLWTFDAVTRLADAQVCSVDDGSPRELLEPKKYIHPGPIWWALDWKSAGDQAQLAGAPSPEVPEGCSEANGMVLLLDEIDKADSSVPNGLLQALGERSFSVRDGRTIRATAGVAPLIVLTTNEERALPAAFLRRCLVLHLALPKASAELVRFLAERGQQHFPRCSKAVREAAAELLVEDRDVDQQRGLIPPGQAEYLDLLRVLTSRAKTKTAQLALLKRVARFALRKHPEELGA